MRTTATNRKVRNLITGIRNGSLVPRPEFQRRLVWSNQHKLNFLDTVLKGYPFPEIYVASGDVDPNTGEGTEMLVDGQQRISTLYEYFTGSNELRLKDDLRPYSDLDQDEKISFLEYDVVVRDLGQMSLDEIKEVFKRINSTNYALNAMEIHNARYAGQFKRFGEALVRDPFFEKHRVFTTADVRRMHDLRFVLTLVATVLSTYFNRDDELETYLKRYNDEFPPKERVNSELDRVFQFIVDCGFSRRGRTWRKPELFSLIVELHRILIRERAILDPRVVGPRVSEFMNSLSQISGSEDSHPALLAYYKASIQATNDRGNRIIRGQILRDVILGEALTVPRVADAS